MPSIVTIDPFTRIEGHLKISLQVENNRVAKAMSSGEMFRGFEQILAGRDPLDAQQITQRICGVCPISHGTASILAQDRAYGVTPTKNGRLARNLILAANYLQSHLLHFYHLAALDFIDITAILNYQGSDPDLVGVKRWAQAELKQGGPFPVAPFLPRYEGKYCKNNGFNIEALHHYLKALDLRKTAHEMVATFGGKAPHAASLMPGGVSQKITIDNISNYTWKLKSLQEFINHTYLPDLLAVAESFPEYFKIGRSCGNFLSYGVFPENEQDSQRFLPAGVIIAGEPAPFNQNKITEQVTFSYYSSASGLHPSQGQTEPSYNKPKAYSWLKAPRYDGQVMEVGPLARVMVAYRTRGNSQVVELTDQLLAKLGRRADDLSSVLGRHIARGIESKILAEKCDQWLEELHPDQPVYQDYDLPRRAFGVGLTEAPRGALGHWLEIDDYLIKRYQCVVPTTWNCSPRDDLEHPGAVEQSLEGTPIADEKNPLEAARVVRSFDPCLACAIH